jgi:hypothetical protein
MDMSQIRSDKVINNRAGDLEETGETGHTKQEAPW